MNDELAQFKSLYIQTAKEHISILKSNLEKFATSEEKEIVENIFIAAHSLKSQSLMMGYQKVGRAAQLIEKTFRNLKEEVWRREQVNQKAINQVVDKVSSWLDAADSASLEPQLDAEIAELEKTLG
jgi:DNA phosphorothioation-dependent restriction protein DptG